MSSPRASASATRTDSSVMSGRNSCSGGSSSRIGDRQPVHRRRGSAGSPTAAAAAAPPAPARARSSSSARISRSTCWRRSPRNMCSVRHSPMPSAPNRRARSASSAVSALARTRSRRTASACAMIRCTAWTRSSASSARPGRGCPRSTRTTGEAHHRHLAGVDHARSSRRSEITSPSWITVPSGAVEPAALGVDVELLGAAHAGLAHPAGDDRGVAGLAAAAGQDALGGDHAVQVVGVGLPADQDDLLPRPAPLHRGVGVEHRLADRRARRGATCPWPSSVSSIRRRVELREHQLRQLGARSPAAAPRRRRSGPRRPAGWRSGTPPPRSACRPGSAASTACRARW